MGSLVVMPIPKEFNCNTVVGSNKYIYDSDIADIHWRLATNVNIKIRVPLGFNLIVCFMVKA